MKLTHPEAKRAIDTDNPEPYLTQGWTGDAAPKPAKKAAPAPQKAADPVTPGGDSPSE